MGLSSDAIWPNVFRENQRWLRLVVRARVREAHSVEEVMQNMALAMARSEPPLCDATRLSAWLYRVAVRQALLFRRRAGRARRLLERAATDRPANGYHTHHDADPLDWLIRRERGQLIRGALDRLAPRDAEILLLKYVENWTGPELSKRLGISLSAIEARLHRARERLRAELVRTHVVEPCE